MSDIQTPAYWTDSRVHKYIKRRLPKSLYWWIRPTDGRLGLKGDTPMEHSNLTISSAPFLRTGARDAHQFAGGETRFRGCYEVATNSADRTNGTIHTPTPSKIVKPPDISDIDISQTRTQRIPSPCDWAFMTWLRRKLTRVIHHL